MFLRRYGQAPGITVNCTAESLAHVMTGPLYKILTKGFPENPAFLTGSGQTLDLYCVPITRHYIALRTKGLRFIFVFYAILFRNLKELNVMTINPSIKSDKICGLTFCLFSSPALPISPSVWPGSVQ